MQYIHGKGAKPLSHYFKIHKIITQSIIYTISSLKPLLTHWNLYPLFLFHILYPETTT